MLRPAVILLCLVTCIWSAESADDTPPPAKDGNRLAYLDECNPWYPHKDFPKLITPQWVGEEGVEAVIVLAIDDMRDPAKYEAYLRPILNRLKQIDGRAPVSIMTCNVKPDDPQLQSWLGEGLSIECHTIDHPCPLLQGGDFDKAKSTYDRCVDLMGKIPGNKPVAFRTPCCDSLNTVSPRFFAEIFNSTTNDGNFLQIDSSVMTFFTSDDESLPKELVLDANGNERFWKYVPKNNKYGGNTHDNFVNYIKNYPYPYVINNSCWEIPCIAPSDWSAQHLHGINNPVTVEDWKAAIDLTVHKQGCFSLVFHPHGWIKPEQIVEMIDHAVAKHGKKVKFLNFAEVAERLNQNLLRTKADQRLNLSHRLIDVDCNGYLDVAHGGTAHIEETASERIKRPPAMWLWQNDEWHDREFPSRFLVHAGHFPVDSGVRFFPVRSPPGLSLLDTNPLINGHTDKDGGVVWSDFDNWAAKPIPALLNSHLGFLTLEDRRFVDLDSDGTAELILFHTKTETEDSVEEIARGPIAEIWTFSSETENWELTGAHFPISPIKHGFYAMRFVDMNRDGLLDLVLSDYDTSGIWLMKSLQTGWPISLGMGDRSMLLPFARKEVCVTGNGMYTLPCPKNNGFFIRDRHFCWINEDTATLPDLMYRVSFDEVLSAKASAQSSRHSPSDAPAIHDAEPTTSGKPSSEGVAVHHSESDGYFSSVPIGAAVVDITPDYPVRLTGYGNRMKESDGVAARIHARALVIGQSSRHSPSDAPAIHVAEPTTSEKSMHDGVAVHHSESDGYFESQTILITVDNCGVPIEITEAVYDRINAKHNIPRERFAISSTHSHSAPWLRGFAPNIFAEIPDDHAAHLAQYEKELTDKLVDVVDKAIARQRPGHLSYGFGEAGFAMNRRALTNGKWSAFGEVPDGPTDKRVPVLAAHDFEGKLIAVLANYACHCTTETGEFNQISGDWAGFAADMLEADHPGAVALIAIGCGADANPSPRGTHEQAKVHGRTIADEVTRILARGRASALRDRAHLSPLPRAGGEGQSEGAAANDPAASSASSPLILPSASVGNSTSRRNDDSSPDLRGEGTLRRINPDILCNMARIDLPLGPIPSRETWEQQAKEPGVTGSRARYFLQMLDEGKPIPTTIPNYPVQTWCFGDDLAMVFLGGEVVVDYSIRMNDMFDSDRLWINAYSNDVPCYIASARVLREGGYECDSSMLYYRRPTRLAPEAEDVICDAVQKLMPHKFYSEKLQLDFPAPKSPEESLKTMTTKPDLRVVLAASEPLIRDPVAFDWDERGRLWVVEMGDYPNGDSLASGRASALRYHAPTAENQEQQDALGGLTPNRSPKHAGRIQILEDTDKNGVYDKATTFLDNLAFPNGIHCWRGGVIVTMAPEIFYAEDTDGDGKADIRETMYKGFVEGNQQHRINGLRWGLDGWLYLANGDSGGEISGTGYVPGTTASGGRQPSDPTTENPSGAASTDSNRTGGLTPNRSPVSLRGRDLRINPDTNELDTVSGQTQFGRERDDFGNWFGNNNSNPIWQYVLEDRYVRRNPHAGISQVTAPVSVIPGAAPVYPTSRTLARFNDFAYANRFTSACSTMIYRDNYLGEQYYGNAFTSEPVHNLVSRLVLTREGYGFKGERAADEQESEFLSSSDNWFRPTMIRTGPDGAIWIADMYRAVIEHPEWIPPEYQRKMNLYAGSDRGRIYRIVPASECCETAASGGREPSGTPTAQKPIADDAAIRTGGLTPNRSQERDGFYDQPWNEIPIADLVKRLESSNGWWRDTAQRILFQRQTVPGKMQSNVPLSLFSDEQPIAVRIQALSAVDRIIGDTVELPAATLGLSDTSSVVRAVSIRWLEESLRNDTVRALAALARVAEDNDPAVRLQLLLSIGDATGDAAATLLGKIFRENFDDTFLRSAGLTSLNPDNISGVLNEALNVPPGQLNEELIGILLAQAAAMGRGEALGVPLTRLVKSVDEAAPASRFEMIAQTLRKVLGSDVAPILKLHKEFETALGQAGTIAVAVAKNESSEADRRSAALRFADVAGQVDPSGEEFNSFLTPQTPTALQMEAVRIIVRSSNPENVLKLVADLKTFEPAVHTELLNLLLQRDSTVDTVLDAVANGSLTGSDFNATQLDGLLHHRNEAIAERARSLLSREVVSSRAAVIDDFKSQISSLKFETSKEEQAAAGKLVFEKRCGTCHKLQDVGKDVGADLAALKDRSTDALLTAILDPNKAVESKFLTYTVVTKDGLQHSGMLKGETGGGLTLIGSEGKELTVSRADIEELVASKRSLMPEGLEKDLSAQDLANVISFVQSTGTPWKRFDGNSPQFVNANADGTITLPASAAEIYGPSLVFEQRYGNLGFWTSSDDYAKWTFEVPKSGHWTVEFDFACDDSTAGSLIKLSTGNRLLSARVPGSGTWDNYQTWQAGTIDLHRGRGQLIVTSPDKPGMALIDLRAIRLIPPK